MERDRDSERGTETERGKRAHAIVGAGKTEISGAGIWSGHSRWLFSCSLPDQCLLYLYLTHLTHLPTYLPQAPAGDCSYQRGREGRAPLLVSLVTNERI